MVANRSQHFVPRCYLRNFSERADGKTISLFNISRRVFIHGAPIKSQCAQNFLYGQDELELHLGDIEGKYAEWVTHGILGRPQSIVEHIDVFFRFFLMIQYMRTEAHAARMRAHISLTDKLADIPADSEFSMRGLDTSDSGLARDGIMFAIEILPQIKDLKFALIRNTSKVKFVTCDDPVVMTNRFYFQRVRDSNFGAGSAGAIYYMPISPDFAALLYDGDIYSPIKSDKIWIKCDKDSDASAFNQLIFLKAKENIYFFQILARSWMTLILLK